MASRAVERETHSGDQSDDGPSNSPRRKVRTGCGTCKVRKVKCDEAKPFCRRCISTGRTCEGYKEPPPPKARVRRSKYAIDFEDDATYRPRSPGGRTEHSALLMSAARTPPLRSPPIITMAFELVADPAAQRSFYYFRHQAVHNISGYFELAFWDYHVLQASYTEPCVLHALLALSSLHESYEVAYLEPHPSARERAGSLKTFALKEYSKAISILANNISTERPPMRVILISCLIFIWIEFIQDNLDTAVDHLKSGLQLLKQTEIYAVDESVTRLFTRLQTQVTVHGNAGFDHDIVNEPMSPVVLSYPPPAFQDMFDARYALDNEFAKIFRFHRQLESAGFIEYQLKHHPFPDQLSLQAICQGHLHNLQQWKLAFHQTRVRSHSPDTDEKQLIALAQLELQYLFVANTLQTLFTTSQMIYDDFAAEFQRMLSLAETLVMGSKDKFYVFAFDTGALSSLFYVVLKYRDPVVRQRAVELLKQAPPREGMWDRESVVEVAEWKIRKEEQGRLGLSPTSPLPNNARIYAESGRETVVDGRNMTVVRYKRGADDPGGEDRFEEELTTFGTRLLGVLGANG